MKQDIKDISEKELTKLYSEYQAGLDRPVPAVVHRQGRRIPGCVSVEEFCGLEIPLALRQHLHCPTKVNCL